MSAQTGVFLTMAGRWAHNVKVSGLDQLPRAEQARALLMFVAGFSAALEATTELAAFEEADALRMLESLHAEVKLIATTGAALVATAAKGH